MWVRRISTAARVAFVEGTGQPEDLLEAAHGLAPHEADARGQGEGVARDGVWQAERRGHRNLERRAARIDTVAVVSPRESDLVAAIPECLGDTLRARPWTTHLRTGKHGDDENLHDSRVHGQILSLPLLSLLSTPIEGPTQAPRILHHVRKRNPHNILPC